MVSVVLAIFALVAFIGQSAAEQIPFLPCEHEKTLTSLYLTPCNTSLNHGWKECVLLHGIDITIDAFFNPPFNSSRLEMVTLATIGGIEIPTPNSGFNPCYGYIAPRCPVEQGKPYLFTRNYTAKDEFHVDTKALRFTIRDMETKEVAACAKIPVVVQPHPSYYYSSP